MCYYPGVTGTCTLPYPLATERPNRSGPRTLTTTCGHPNGLRDRYVTSNGKFQTREFFMFDDVVAF